jgi:putative tricarboxylic transport membrane protein
MSGGPTHDAPYKGYTTDRKEVFLSLAALLLGLIVAISSLAHNIGTLTKPGPTLLPFLTALCLILTGFFSLIGALRGSGHDSADTNRLLDRSVFKVVAVVVAMGVYTLILASVGYLLSTFFLLAFLFKTAGFRSWIAALATSFLVTSSSYLLFAYALKVRFPTGIFSL